MAMTGTVQERRALGLALDELRAAVELAIRPGSAIAQRKFTETGRTTLFSPADLEALKSAIEMLREKR